MILLAEHDEPSLAATKKRRLGASSRPTFTPKNRVWDFGTDPSGRPCVEPQLSWEIATGSVQYTYQNASGRAGWLSRDPLKNAERLQGPNLYDYCLNNPVDLTDPFGTTSAGIYGQGTAFVGRGGLQVKLAVVYDFCQLKYCATISLSGLIGAGAYGGAGLGGQGNAGSGPITPGNNTTYGGAGAAAADGGASASAQWTPSGINGTVGAEAGEGGFGGFRISREYTACAGDPFTATADAFAAMVNELNALYQSLQ